MQIADRKHEIAEPGFRIPGPRFSLHIAGDCPETLGFLERYFLPTLPRTRGRRASGDIPMLVSRTEKPGYLNVQWNGRTIARSERLPYLFTLIQQAADDETLRHLEREAVVHAGVVAHRDRAILLPGHSGSGKSSLVRELLRQGAVYCSDEYAIVDPRGWVHPYPRALFIRDEAGDQIAVLPSDLAATVRGEPAPAALILFLAYRPGAEFEISRLDQSEALMRLLENTPDVLAEKPHVFEPLKAAVSRAVSFAGVRGDGAEAAARVLDLLDETP